MTTTIWHNPRCSKSRQTLTLLQDKGAEIDIVDYQNNPPSIEMIENALALLGAEPRDIIRKGEQIFKDEEIAKITDRAALVEAMHKFPKLIERPIVFHNGKAAIGRPPEAVLELF